MDSKTPVSGRIPPETDERLTEYREEHDLNQSDAIRKLLDAGLDAEFGSDDEDDEIEIGPLTQSEKWFRQKFEASVAGFLLSAPVTLALFIALSLASVFLEINIAEWLPTQLLSLLILIGISAFVVFVLAALFTGLVLRSGLARWLDERTSAEKQEVAT